MSGLRVPASKENEEKDRTKTENNLKAREIKKSV